MLSTRLNRIRDTHFVNRVTTILQDHMARFGYQPLATPIIERADLFLTRAGDQVINKLFTFNRHGQELALRPEFTAIAVHYFIHHAQQAVARWQFSGPIFVDDPGNHQQEYQQESLGAELIGLTGSAIDAELIGLAVQGLKRVNIPEYRLVVGHAGLTRHLLRRHQLDSRTEQFLLKHIDALHQPDLGKPYVLEQFEYLLKGTPTEEPVFSSDGVTSEQTEANTQRMLQSLLDATRRSATMGGRTQHDIARRLLQKQQRLTETQQVHAALDFLEAWTGIQAVSSEAFTAIEGFVKDDPVAADLFHTWQETINLLDAYEICSSDILIRPYLARNWAYYTGIVFEVSSQDHTQLGSGGRYDELVALIGGSQAIPAVGFAYYLDSVFDCLESPSPDLQLSLCVGLTDDNGRAATQLATLLRRHDLTVVLLPVGEVDNSYSLIHVDAEGRITFGNQQYMLPSVETLVTAIRQSNHVE